MRWTLFRRSYFEDQRSHRTSTQHSYQGGATTEECEQAGVTEYSSASYKSSSLTSLIRTTCYWTAGNKCLCVITWGYRYNTIPPSKSLLFLTSPVGTPTFWVLSLRIYYVHDPTGLWNVLYEYSLQSLALPVMQIATLSGRKYGLCTTQPFSIHFGATPAILHSSKLPVTTFSPPPPPLAYVLPRTRLWNTRLLLCEL